MQETLIQIKRGFKSSNRKTDEFKAFCRTFRSELRKLLKPHAKEIKFNIGHFYISGFIQLNDDRIFYFNTGDLRFSTHHSLMLRTAEDFKDYTGGFNQFVEYQNWNDTTMFQFKILSILGIEVQNESN
jgi:hypothetical protein